MNLPNPLSILFGVKEFSKVVILPLREAVTGLANPALDKPALGLLGPGRQEDSGVPQPLFPRVGPAPLVPVVDS